MDDEAPQERSPMPADWPAADAHLVNGGYYTESVSFPGPTPATAHLWITVRWCLMYGHWEAVGLSLDFAPHARVRALQRRDLSLIKMGDVLDRAARELEKLLDDNRVFGSEVEVWSLGYDANGEVVRTVTSRPNDAVAPAARPKRGDRPPRPPEWAEETMRVYNEAYKNGQSPTKAVREHFGIGRDNAARYVWLCRHKYRLLPDTKPGYARGLEPPKHEEDK